MMMCGDSVCGVPLRINPLRWAVCVSRAVYGKRCVVSDLHGFLENKNDDFVCKQRYLPIKMQNLQPVGVVAPICEAALKFYWCYNIFRSNLSPNF